MKRLFIIAAILLFSSPAHSWPWGKYPSKEEALQACYKWVAKKGTIQVRVWKHLRQFNLEEPFLAEHSIRSCRNEEETRQYLGYDKPDAISGQIIEKGNTYPKKMIVKRFRY